MDLIRESGIAIVDFNFGGHSNDKAYKDEGTRVWYTVAKLIKGGRIAAQVAVSGWNPKPRWRVVALNRRMWRTRL